MEEGLRLEALSQQSPGHVGIGSSVGKLGRRSLDNTIRFSNSNPQKTDGVEGRKGMVLYNMKVQDK